jgi:hypothetical protein
VYTFNYARASRLFFKDDRTLGDLPFTLWLSACLSLTDIIYWLDFSEVPDLPHLIGHFHSAANHRLYLLVQFISLPVNPIIICYY